MNKEENIKKLEELLIKLEDGSVSNEELDQIIKEMSEFFNKVERIIEETK